MEEEGRRPIKSVDGQIAKSVYQYCLHYFEGAECPLGSATAHLAQYMGGQVIRTLSGSNVTRTVAAVASWLTPPLQQLVPLRAAVANRSRRRSSQVVSAAEKSHVLSDYNDRMLHVHTLLLTEKPANYILMIMKLNQSLA